MDKIGIDMRPVLAKTLEITPISSRMITELQFFCLAARDVRIMVFQLGIKNGVFHPFSGKD